MRSEVAEKSPRDRAGYLNMFTEDDGHALRPWYYIPVQHLLIMLICSYFLFFFRIGAHDLWSPDEPRYAQVAREMLRSGDYIVPHLNGEIYTEKPPLYFWMVAFLSKPFGDVNETTARIPSAVAALLTMLATYLLGVRLLGRREALVGTLAMATSAQFIWIGRIGVLDMPLTLAMTAAVALFYAGYRRKSILLYLAGFLFLAPAAMSKGPVGVVIPILVMLVFLAIEMMLHKEDAGREMRRFALCILPGLALVALLVVPWWGAAFERSGGVYGSLSILLKQTRGRMVQSYSHRQPILYYFYNIVWQLLPWTAFVPLTAHALRTKGRLREHEGLLFLVVWFAATFVFFTLVSGKRSQYILPLFPAAGLILGWALVACNPFEGRLKERKVFSIPLLLLAIGLAGVLIAFPIAVFHFLPKSFPVALVSSIVALPVLFLIIRRAPQRHPAFALDCLVLAAVVLAVGVFAYLAPAIDAYKSARPFCSQALAAAGNDDAFFFYRVYRPNVNYYMGRSMKRLNSKEEVLQALGQKPRIYLILHQDRLDELASEKSITIEEVAREQIGSHSMVCALVQPAGELQRYSVEGPPQK